MIRSENDIINFFLFMDVEKKEAKKPNSTPKGPQAHARAPLGSMPAPLRRPKARES